MVRTTKLEEFASSRLIMSDFFIMFVRLKQHPAPIVANSPTWKTYRSVRVSRVSDSTRI